MINFIKDAVTAVSGIKSFIYNTDYRNNFDIQDVDFPCCVLTPIMQKSYDLKNIIHEKAKLQMSIVELAPYDYTGDDLYAINKRCSDLAMQVIANLQVKTKLDKELTFEFILPSGDELISGVMCNLQVTMKQGSCIGSPSYVEVVVQPVKRETITTNGKHVISPSSGFNAMREVEVDVNVDLKGSLQDKQVTITENGTTTITADKGYEALNSVEVNSEVYEGFDLVSAGYSKERATEVNSFHSEKLNESLQLKKEIGTPNGSWYLKFTGGNFTIFPYVDTSLITDIRFTFRYCRQLRVIPDFDFSRVTSAEEAFHECFSLLNVPKYINIGNCTNFRRMFMRCCVLQYAPFMDLSKAVQLDGMFSYCYSLKYAPPAYSESTTTIYEMFSACHELESDIHLFTDNVTQFNYAFYQCFKVKSIILTSIEKNTTFNGTWNGLNALETLKFIKWKTLNIELRESSKLLPSSIHYIIQNAMSVADGAKARILVLHATAKVNWQNSEYYEQDLAVLTDKGITIA